MDHLLFQGSKTDKNDSKNYDGVDKLPKMKLNASLSI